MLKTLGYCALNWTRVLQVASCLLFGKDRSRRTVCVVPACDDWHGKLVEVSWNGWRTIGLPRLIFKLYLIMERQLSWRVISVHKTPHYFPATTRLSHRLQVCYWVLILRRSNKTHCKPDFPPSLPSLRHSSGQVCGV